VAVVVVVMVVRSDYSVMPVSITDADSDATNADFDVFRDDHRFVASARSAGKRRHGQKRNNEQGKQDILHDAPLSLVGDSSVPMLSIMTWSLHLKSVPD
jgi:hypothetical protein